MATPIKPIISPVRVPPYSGWTGGALPGAEWAMQTQQANNDLAASQAGQGQAAMTAADRYAATTAQQQGQMKADAAQRAQQQAQQRAEAASRNAATDARYQQEFLAPRQQAADQNYADTVRHETWNREDEARRQQQSVFESLFSQMNGGSSGPASPAPGPSAAGSVAAGARDSANQQAQVAQHRLGSSLAARGMGGAGYEAGKIGDIVGQAAQTEGESRRQQQQMEQQRQWALEDQAFQAQEAQKARNDQLKQSLSSMLMSSYKSSY